MAGLDGDQLVSDVTDSELSGLDRPLRAGGGAVDIGPEHAPPPLEARSHERCDESTPALAMSTRTKPSVCSTWANIASTASGCPTPSAIAMAGPLADRIAATASFGAVASLRQLTATAGVWASRSDIARPIPRDPPVTKGDQDLVRQLSFKAPSGMEVRPNLVPADVRAQAWAVGHLDLAGLVPGTARHP